MRRPRILVVGACLLLAGIGGNAWSQTTGEAGAFVKNLVDAINSKNLDRRKALVHPKSLVCATAEPGSFYYSMATRQARDTVPAGYKWKITPVQPDQPPLFADKFDYPVRPTHLLQLDFETGANRSKTMILQIVHDGTKWHEVIACPKPETVAAARAAGQAKAERAKRAQMLVAEIAPQLKEEVLGLLKQGRRIDAIKQYQSASGEDLTTAVEVVELLTSRAR